MDVHSGWQPASILHHKLMVRLTIASSSQLHYPNPASHQQLDDNTKDPQQHHTHRKHTTCLTTTCSSRCTAPHTAAATRAMLCYGCRANNSESSLACLMGHHVQEPLCSRLMLSRCSPGSVPRQCAQAVCDACNHCIFLHFHLVYSRCSTLVSGKASGDKATVAPHQPHRGLINPHQNLGTRGWNPCMTINKQHDGPT